MPDRRKGAPGSFGAPLDDLLPRLGDHAGREHDWTDVNDAGRKRKETAQAKADRCRNFLLNQSLYERAKKER